MKHTVTQVEIGDAAEELAHRLVKGLSETHRTYIYGVPRGGIPAAYAVAWRLAKRQGACTVVDNPAAAGVIIDDLVDSGKTRERFADKPFGALFSKKQGPWHYGTEVDPATWLVFPWEGSEIGSADDIITRMLQFIGEDPAREGLRETPARVIKAWREEWFSGYGKKPEEVLKAFADGSEDYDEMILVKDIPVYTHCEHHLAPFFGVAHIGYVPRRKIVGLSKLSRLVDIFARRLQVQERLTTQIAGALQEHLQPAGVGVVIQCRHLCMESRGIQRQGALTTTSKMLGVMMSKPEARAELFSLINRS